MPLITIQQRLNKIKKEAIQANKTQQMTTISYLCEKPSTQSKRACRGLTMKALLVIIN
jgi:hypothetical protein